MGLGLIISIIVGGFAGWAASRFMKARTGLLANILLGVGGAIVLNWVLGAVGIYASSALVPQFIVACAGAAALIWIGRQLRK
ncbi:MAG: GlsB/YeaQ/YmgE family stress response membrane protein [Pseudomonadota bacterium]